MPLPDSDLRAQDRRAGPSSSRPSRVKREVSRAVSVTDSATPLSLHKSSRIFACPPDLHGAGTALAAAPALHVGVRVHRADFAQ